MTGPNIGADFLVTSAGSSAQDVAALRAALLAGYTGSNMTMAGTFNNVAAGTGSNLANGLFNAGARGVVISTTTGSNVGLFGTADGGNRSVGTFGRSTTAKNSATNIGALGYGLNTGTTPVQIGGYFGLTNTDPTFTSAALMADNGTQTDPIFVARDNGTPVFSIADGGVTTLTSSFSAASYKTATNCADSAGAAACGSAAAGSFVIDATATSTVVSTTAVTANSQVFVQEDSSLGARLGVTCNTQSILVLGAPVITARSTGVSFTATIVLGPTTNPMCVSYYIVN